MDRRPQRKRAAILPFGGALLLAPGVPLAKLLFAAHPGLGMILLPVVIDHPLQPLVCAGIARGGYARFLHQPPRSRQQKPEIPPWTS